MVYPRIRCSALQRFICFTYTHSPESVKFRTPTTVFPFFVPPFAAAEQHDIHKKIMEKKPFLIWFSNFNPLKLFPVVWVFFPSLESKHSRSYRCHVPHKGSSGPYRIWTFIHSIFIIVCRWGIVFKTESKNVIGARLCFQLSSHSPLIKVLSLANPCENRIMKHKNLQTIFEICIQELCQIRTIPAVLIWVYINILREIPLFKKIPRFTLVASCNSNTSSTTEIQVLHKEWRRNVWAEIPKQWPV